MADENDNTNDPNFKDEMQRLKIKPLNKTSKPISSDAKNETKTSIKKKPVKIRARTANQFNQSNYYNIHEIAVLGKPVGAEEYLQFARHGISSSIIRQLKQGLFEIEAGIDLHRCTMDAANSMLINFIKNCITGQRRVARIIHGKAHRAEQSTPILKTYVYHWLKHCPDVLAFNSALPNDGGAGALYVLLKLKHEKHP